MEKTMPGTPPQRRKMGRPLKVPIGLVVKPPQVSWYKPTQHRFFNSDSSFSLMGGFHPLRPTSTERKHMTDRLIVPESVYFSKSRLSFIFEGDTVRFEATKGCYKVYIGLLGQAVLLPVTQEKLTTMTMSPITP